jgi:hypothetical protein
LLRENQARQVEAIETHLCFHSLRTEKQSSHKESLCNPNWLQHLARISPVSISLASLKENKLEGAQTRW